MPDSHKKKDLRKYNDSFLREVAKLNPAQRRAVEQIEGPVMVIAGPGTGKTHILTSRIGRILMETDAQAHNILCLTFTDAGAFAMRRRLLQFIGPEAHRVHIFTFHSFCNKIIKENLELFGRHDLEQVSELERVEIIRAVIDDLQDPHPLKKGSDRYFYEGWLKDLFQKMKTENWSLNHISQQVEAFIKDIPLREAFIYKVNNRYGKKGEPKQGKIDEWKEKMHRLVAAAKLYPAYQQKMTAAGRYDFDDMILWVIKAFEEHEELLRRYQEQYLYFLVDEYQDTNGSQNKIIDQLIRYWETPNIFIVGDDDQSIFEFQGARLQNLIYFHNRFSQFLKPIILEDNYRSTQNILEAAQSLIDFNQKRIINHLDNVEKKLLARNPLLAQSSTKPEIICYSNNALEGIDIVKQIAHEQQQGFPLNEIAIIYAQHRQVEDITLLLEKKGIPYTTRRKVNILDTSLIIKLRTLLEYLLFEYERPFSGEHLLYKILYFDFLNIQPSDIARLSLFSAKDPLGKRKYWRKMIGDKAVLRTAEIEEPENFLRLSQIIESLIPDIANLHLNGFLEILVNQSGLMIKVLQSPQKVWQLQLIHSFFNFAKKESRKNPRLSLRRFWDMLKSMDESKIPLAVQKTMETENGVQLMTAHSSKGLEFRKVFMINCVDKFWESRKAGNNQRFALPDTLTLSGEEDSTEARRRLFYVGMTRAKEQLHISFSEQGRDGKPLQATAFIDQILETNPTLSIQHKTLDPALVIEAQTQLLLKSEKPKIPTPSGVEISRILDTFQLSVSALNSYLACPIGFYFEYILRVPSVESEAASYGTAIHFALKRFFDNMLLSIDKNFPPLDRLINFFEEEMKRSRAKFTKKEYLRRLAIGKENLISYHQHYIHEWNKKVQIELDVSNVEFENIPLKGTIDKVETIDPIFVNIVDYKTGSHKSEKTKKPTDKKPLGGSYWRQLLFYKVLYESHKAHTKIVKSGTIAFIEPDKYEKIIERRFEFAPEEVEKFKVILKNSYDKIMNQEFTEGCGEAKCKWCNFTREHIVPESFRNELIEEMDDR